jgi:ABC-type sulfate/molybdate transport systems ATPase subunit
LLSRYLARDRIYKVAGPGQCIAWKIQFDKFGEAMGLLRVSGISKKEEGTYILRDLSFSNAFQKMAIAGETGSGKTTALKIIAGLIQPDSGEVFFENERVKGPEEKLLPGHPGIAYLSQHFELRNNYRVEEILSYANQRTDEEAAALYELCRISHLLKRKTDRVSGGERQRIAIARLLISSPRLLLLDEPYSNLDIIHRDILKAVINDIGERLHISCILVSHDPQDILSWADEIIILKQGRMIQQGTPEAIYRTPVDAYAAGLFGKYNLMDNHLATVFGLANKLNGQELFIRPEQFRLSNEQKPGSVKCTVEELRFAGMFYEADVLVEGKKLTVRTNRKIAEGEESYLSLPV